MDPTPLPPTPFPPISTHTAPTSPLSSLTSAPSSLAIIPISRTDIFPLPSPRITTINTANQNGENLTNSDGVNHVAPPPPFPLLPGEGVVDMCGLLDEGRLILTNYRLYIQLGEVEQYHVPLGLVESVEVKELFYLGIGCKDARTYRCTFDNNEQCLQWFGTLLKSSEPPRQLQELFAFSHYAWSKEKSMEDFTLRLEPEIQTPVYDEDAFMKEVERLQFGSVWRISSANDEYKMCSSYPPKLLVPSNIQDDKLEAVAKFRSSRRIPAVVWRHVGNGAVIARCSQPEVGWLGWRSSDDEDLVKEILHACAMDAMPSTALDTYSHSPALSSDEDMYAAPVGQVSPLQVQLQLHNGAGGGVMGGGGGGGGMVNGGGGVAAFGELKVNTEKKVLIMDARSYTTAVANRARGGGCECPEYYPTCEIQFMNLANIHSIRKSFHALRQLCTSAADQPNWFSLLEGTRWLLHQSGLMRAAVTLVTAVERDARPVLVHCSDGWDRTPQIVALAQLLLDPYYRTIDGFRILIEREWLAFGHKFADRCGHTTGSEDQNERCPVFLQWLDCVHQLIEQFPCSFEFSDIYLVKLVQHTYSNLFGTFLCNTKKDRDKQLFNTFPVWTFLDSPQFRNYLYRPAPPGVQVLWPQCNVRDLKIWSAVYLGSLETNIPSTTTTTITQQPSTVNNPNSTNPTTTTTSIVDTPTTTTTTIMVDPNTTINLCAKPTNKQQPSIKTTTAATAMSATMNVSMTKTRSYGDLVQMQGLGLGGCGAAVTQRMARVGVGGGGGEVTDGLVMGGRKEELRACSSRRLSDPSTVDIKILNLAMADHSDTTQPPESKSTIAGLLPTTHTYNPTTSATPQQSSSALSTSNQSETTTTAALLPNGSQNTPDSLSEDEDYSTNGDINHNDNREGNDSSVKRTVLHGAVVMSLKDSCERLLNGNSVETSTETLVAENGTMSFSPIVASPCCKPFLTSNNHDQTDGQTSASVATNNCQTSTGSSCQVCAQNKRLTSMSDDAILTNGADNTNGYYTGSSNVTSGVNTPTSRMTDDSATAMAGLPMMESPAFFNGISTSGYWASCSVKIAPNATLGDDGLVPLRSEMQDRVSTLIEENRREVERLKHELQKYRFALLQQLCHRCHHNDTDKYDDASSALGSDHSACHTTCHAHPNHPHHHHYHGHHRYATAATNNTDAATDIASLRSDLSWENVDDGPDAVAAAAAAAGGVLSSGVAGLGGNPTLWMPDHAVNRCGDCRCEFWIGRRRHHCRKCGQIFCGECSENFAPIPTEHLYTPVRVCRGCFTKLRQARGESATLDDTITGNGENGDCHNTNEEEEGGMVYAKAEISTNLCGDVPPPTTPHPPTLTSLHHHHHHTHLSNTCQTPVIPRSATAQCCHHQHQRHQKQTAAAVGAAPSTATTTSGNSGAVTDQRRRIAASSN